MIRRAACWFVLFAGLWAGPVFAQDPSPDAGTPAPPAITPPRLVNFVEAVYPPEAAAAGTGAEVELAITIAADGTVSDVQVVTPVGNGFDEAAVAAARQFTFEPARRDGAPMAARIRYRYVFELRTPEVAVEEAIPEEVPETLPGAIDLRIVDEAGNPLVGARIVLTHSDGTALGEVVTDAQGRASVRDVAPGSVRLVATLAGHTDNEASIDVTAGESVSFELALLVPRDTESFGATARIDPPPREVTRRTIEAEEFLRVPGTRGDALRAIELLPGVGRPSFLAGQVIIRGSAPGDSQVFLEGMPVPLLYHFGGLTSFINSRLLQRIDFYPGNFSSRFGRKIGGVIDVGIRDPRTDQYHGVADLNLIDASILVEGPIGDNAGFALAFRRSYIDFFFSEVIPRGTFDTLAAPVYYDYQAIATWRPTSDDRFRAFLYGSSDVFNVILPTNGDTDPTVSGNADLASEFHRLQLSWRRRISNDVDLNVELAGGPQNTRFALGEAIKFQLSTFGLYARAEVTARLSSRVRIIAGLDLNLLPTDISFRGPQPGQGEGNPGGGPLGSRASVSSLASVTVYRPAAYLEASWQPWDPLLVVAGMRLDYYREVGRWSFDPRLSARYSITGQTDVKAGVGLFTQPPEFQESAPLTGNPNLLPIRALHTSAGVDHRFDDTYSVGVEGFYKELYDRVTGTAGSLAPFFENNGVGRIYGMEVSGRARPTGRFIGFLSYTLMRSERRDNGGEWRLFDSDQTHILTISGTYRIGDGWEVGGTFRLVTGNPRTPVIGSIYNANNDLYTPVYGAVNSARSDWFHRLDLRVEKVFTLDFGGRIAIYLDIQNVYNNRNPEGIQYNFDYSQSSTLMGLPIIPSLGFRGEI